MTSTPSTPDPVVSGVPYTVHDVDGAAVGGLAELVGTHELTLERRGATHVVRGQGVLADDGASVRFLEKDALRAKDVRPWRVTPDGDGFSAVSGVS